MITFKELDTKKSSEQLVPVIIQDDATLKVLMLGYMNEEAFDKSLSEGRVTFYSRSKERLWTKGETSGNFLNIKSVSMDCDSDTLLIRVHPQGNVCHSGKMSCFDSRESEGFIGKLAEIIRERHIEMPNGSYTTKLFEKGINKIAQKVGEEATETVIEAVDGNKERLIYELSDLVYHILVLMESQSITIEQIEEELISRHK